MIDLLTFPENMRLFCRRIVNDGPDEQRFSWRQLDLQWDWVMCGGFPM